MKVLTPVSTASKYRLEESSLDVGPLLLRSLSSSNQRRTWYIVAATYSLNEWMWVFEAARISTRKDKEWYLENPSRDFRS